MPEYIRKDAVLFLTTEAVAWELQDKIEALPVADVQPVRHGKWERTMMSEATGWDLSLTGGRDEVCEYNCSVCGQANILDEFGEDFLPPYCPNCGADMRDTENVNP